MKRCPTCKQDKPKTDFNKSRNRSDSLDWQCRECAHNKDARYRKTEHAKELSRAKAKRYRERDPERFKRNRKRWFANLSPEKKRLYHRKCNLKKLYGLTLEEYDELYQRQEGRCAICGGFMKSPCVDHNHEIGEIRGLLCVPCNFVLGEVKENPRILEAMLKYLTRPPLVLGKPDDAIPHANKD